MKALDVMPQFLYRIQPVRVRMFVKGPTALEAAIVREHFDCLTNVALWSSKRPDGGETDG